MAFCQIGLLYFAALGLRICSGRKGKAAKTKGLSGYDLIDKHDRWFGHDIPEYGDISRLLDGFGDRNGEVDLSDWLATGLPQNHFTYFDKDGDGLLSDAESWSWFLQRQPAKTMNLSEVHNPPRGHLQKLGYWKDPLPADDLIYHKPYPHPRDFWRKHMDGYLPAILKGAQHGWPAMNWTKENLQQRFGWVDVKLEPKVEGRGNDTAYEELDRLAPRHRLNISEYLRMEEGKNMYVVSILPQAMAWEISHPAALLCGSRKQMLNKHTKPPYEVFSHKYPHESGHEWMTHLFEANLWIASGFTRSQFHYDKEWNVNCLLSGRKRWFFLNAFWYDKELQWARGNKFRSKDPLNNAWTDWVYLDPDHVDLIVQHKLRNMDYYELYQEAGDCIFIPYAMLHQVEKLNDDMQVAASWMFLPETIYDEEACAKAPLDEDLPLAVMDTLYMYTGKGIIPQGYGDPLNFVKDLRDRMALKHEQHLTLKTFAKAVSRGEAILSSGKDRKKKIEGIFKLITSYAKDPSKGLAQNELRNVPLRVWCKPAAEGDTDGPLPCDDGEEYTFCNDTEFEKMEGFLRKRGAAIGKQTAVREPTGKLPKHLRVYPHERLQHDEL